LKDKTKNNWNDIYKREFAGMWYPSESIVKFSARYLKRRLGINKWQTKRKVTRILDAGCGLGRHVMFFQEQDYETYGLDISNEAVEIGNEWIKSKGLKPTLKVGDITTIPFENDYFDIVISHETLDHILFSHAKKVINEIKRVCSTGGYVYISLRSTKDSEFGRGEKVEHNTFVLQEGYEKGLIQHYFDKNEIADLLNGFKIFDISLHEDIFSLLNTVLTNLIYKAQKVLKNTLVYLNL